MVVWTCLLVAGLALGAMVVFLCTTVLSVNRSLEGNVDLGDGNWSQGEEVVKELGGQGRAARKLGLYLAMPEKVAPRKAEAALALGCCGRHGVPALCRALGSANEDTRGFAAGSLTHLGPEATDAVPALIQALRNHKDEWAVEALGAIGPAASSATDVLLETCREADPGVRSAAVAALGSIGADADRAVPALCAALKDDDDLVRLNAACSLGEYGAAAAKAVPALTAALQDSRPDVKSAAALALGHIGRAARGSVPALEKLMRHYEVGYAAAAALARICAPDNRKYVEALAGIAGDKRRGGSRLEAIAELGELGKMAAAAVPHLTRIAGDRREDELYRDAAAEALKKIRGEESKP